MGPDSSPVHTRLSPSQPGALAVSHSPWLPEAARTKRFDPWSNPQRPFTFRPGCSFVFFSSYVNDCQKLSTISLASALPFTPCSVGESGLANALPSHFHLPRKTLKVSSSAAGLGAGGG